MDIWDLLHSLVWWLLLLASVILEDRHLLRALNWPLDLSLLLLVLLSLLVQLVLLGLARRRLGDASFSLRLLLIVHDWELPDRIFRCNLL